MSIRRSGLYPTNSVTRAWMPSIEAAARRAHGSKGAGKWTRKCSVSIVRHGAEGDCPASPAAVSHSAAAQPNLLTAGRLSSKLAPASSGGTNENLPEGPSGPSLLGRRAARRRAEGLPPLGRQNRQ